MLFRSPEPVPLSHLADLGRAGIKCKARPGKQGDPQIARQELITPQRHLPLPSFRKEESGIRPIGAPAEQYAGLIPFEQKNDRQESAIDISQGPAHDFARQARSGRRTSEQRRGQIAVLKRQAGRERCTRTGPAVQVRQLDQTGKQGVMMKQVLTQRLPFP